MISGTKKFWILSLSLFSLCLVSAAPVLAAPFAPDWTSSETSSNSEPVSRKQDSTQNPQQKIPQYPSSPFDYLEGSFCSDGFASQQCCESHSIAYCPLRCVEGTCQKLRSTDPLPCKYRNDCPFGICIGGACHDNRDGICDGRPGEARQRQCGVLQFCDKSQQPARCVNAKAEGEECTPASGDRFGQLPGNCAPGMLCRPTGTSDEGQVFTCRASQAEGEQCAFSDLGIFTCGPGLFCDLAPRGSEGLLGRCVRYREPGEKCMIGRGESATALPCANGALCDRRTGKCPELTEDGQECSGNQECRSGFCSKDKICVPRRS